MFDREMFGGQPAFIKELAKWCFLHCPCNVPAEGTCANTGMYLQQVLDPHNLWWQIMEMGNRLAILRKEAGITQAELAAALNSGRSTVTKLERGEIPLHDRWLEKLSLVLNCAPSDILGDTVPIVGKIGAGGSIVYEDVGSDELIQRPPNVTGNLVGLEVAGDSMLPKFDSGDVVYISRDHDGIDLSYLGAICACRLVTGETYLKQLLRGATPGTFTLRSYNAADMEDCELLWASPIRAITPRYAR